MLRRLSACVAGVSGAVFVSLTAPIALKPAHADGSGACFRGRFGTTVDCGGGYVIPPAPSPARPPSVAPSPRPSTSSSGPTIPLALYVANGPNGPCMAMGPANPTPNATVSAWLATVHYPNCPTTAAVRGQPAPQLPPIDPVTLAVQFWQTIPLPTPKPDIPPGYAVTGKEAYLVTNGTTSPPPFREVTPLGPLTVTAVGTYRVDWGDPGDPGWTGPYAEEGQAWPNGQITHVYENAGTDNVTVDEDWTATWQLAGAHGNLGGLHTTATINGFKVEQLQAVLTN